MSLTAGGGDAPATPFWQANLTPAKNPKCNSSIALYNATTASIFFG
jgi:hypothetical protein